MLSLSPGRRRVARIPVDSDLWVYWEAHPHHDISRVRDLSAAGLFLETRFRKAHGDRLFIHFLVQEGQIRIEALVRHVFLGQGLGLKLRSVAPSDIRQFDALLARIRSSAPLPC